MAITYPLALPTPDRRRRVTLDQMSAVAETRSPFTDQPQVLVHQGQWWEANVIMALMKRPDAEQWIAFLAKLNGKEGTFLMGDPLGATPRGSAAGSPLVNGAGQQGSDLVIDSAPVSVTGWMLTGDYVQLGSASTARLFKVLDDVNTDSGGNATLTIWPQLNLLNQPANNAPLVITNCVGRFRLTSNRRRWNADEAAFYAIQFAAKSEP